MSDNYTPKNSTSYREPKSVYNSIYESLENIWNKQNPNKVDRYTPTHKKGTIFMSSKDFDNQLNRMLPKEKELEIKARNDESLMFKNMKISQLIGEENIDSFKKDPMNWFLNNTGLNPYSNNVDINSEIINIFNMQQTNPFMQDLPKGDTINVGDF
tara:strand:+ start:1630 stop:2097 length:468 start_codon:yes stop_codon:yes gene_type:complete